MIDALSIVLRSLSFIAIFQAAGMAMFLALFGRSIGDGTAASLTRAARVAAAVGLVLVVAHFSLEPARMSGSLAGLQDRSLWELVLGTSSATALIWRLAGLAVLTVARPLALIGAAMVLASFTQTGHTTVFSPRLLLASLLFVHVAIVAFWFGALLPLAVVARRESAPSAVQIVERFSRIAVWWVPCLLGVGLLLAALLSGSWQALQSPYARLLTVKIALFASLLILAALNRSRFGPALARGDAGSRRAFSRTLVVEFVLIAAALSATATLTTLYSPES